MPLVPQAIGNDPVQFSAFGSVVAETGYSQINWNLGCPFGMVTKKKRGAGLLPNIKDIARFLDYCARHLPVSLSVKARLGLSGKEDLLKLIPLFNDYPLFELIIHPRTAVDMYHGPLDPDVYGRCLAASRIPVVWSGDICGVEDFKRLRVRFPETAAWMIGRGALMDPFLPGRLKGRPPVSDPVTQVRAFHDDLYGQYLSCYDGPSPVLGKMKELWGSMHLAFDGGAKFWKRVRKCRSLAGYTETTARFFDSRPFWREGSRAA